MYARGISFTTQKEILLQSTSVAIDNPAVMTKDFMGTY